jgi:FlaA1/EpsC-like NDP-sugar epimerase
VRSPLSRHSIWQVVVDACLVAGAWWLAWSLRFEHRPVYYDRYLDWQIVLLVVAIKLPVFALSGFYNRWWRYVSTRDMWGVLRGVVLASIAVFVVFTLFDIHRAAVPRGVWFIDLLLCLALVAGARLLTRTIIERPLPGRIVTSGKEAVIVGAGDAGQLVIKEMQRNPSVGYTPIGLVDDDPRKRNLRLHGVRVLGTVADLAHVIRDRHPDEVLIAIPSASGRLRAQIVDTARSLHVPVKTLPSLSDLVSGDADLALQLRPVEVEDVLGREPVEVDIESISGYLEGEVVLVTGAGGSIGSELCRQIARVDPAKLVLLDNAEPALFEIERELVRDRGFLAAAAVVGDVKDPVKLRQVFDKYRPGVVFHAAAYKHVAMMEANPLEAVRNNTLGTRVVADVAAEYGAKRFVLVSTDKAANPKTVMGQSKALAEWIVETWGHREGVTTRFVAVRFGNVLGSSGSVVPIFRRQIARGGPVTVTHPEMTRFFMTITEAVQLIVQAGAIGGRGQVYVLDMGEPVRIVDLAENMVRLSGKEPGRDIAIEFIGPAPGEKLHEELVGDGETVSPSPHAKIDLIARPPVDPEWLEEELAMLERLVEDGDTLELVGTLRRLVDEPRRERARAAEPRRRLP